MNEQLNSFMVLKTIQLSSSIVHQNLIKTFIEQKVQIFYFEVRSSTLGTTAKLFAFEHFWPIEA